MVILHKDFSSTTRNFDLTILKNYIIMYLQGKENTLKKFFQKNLKKMLTTLKKFDIINISNETSKQIHSKKEVYFMEKKITKAQMFALIKAEVADKPEMVEFLDKQIELLAKKSANKKPSAVQVANEALKEDILAVLAGFEDGATATDVLNGSEKFAGLSNQKVATMLNQLVAVGKVAKDKSGKKTLFSVVD